MKIRKLTLFALIGLLLFAGCSCSQPVPKTALIKIQTSEGMDTWWPTDVEITKGGTVTWLNTSSNFYSHSVISGDGLFPEAKLNPGQSFSFTFTKKGTFTYRDAENSIGTVIDTSGTIYVR